MPAQIEAVFGRNVTLVYDALDPNTVDRNQIRKLIPGASPTIMDMPEMIVAVYPPNPLVIQIGDRRIRVNLAAETTDLGDFPVWEYAYQCKDLLANSKSSLIAYGYNFDFAIFVPEKKVENILIENFVSDRATLEAKLQGQLLSFIPRLVFKNGNVQYDIIFELFDDHHVKVHGNAHFQEPEIQLPDLNDLRESYIKHYDRLHDTLLDLLNA